MNQIAKDLPETGEALESEKALLEAIQLKNHRTDGLTPHVAPTGGKAVGEPTHR